MDIYLGVDGGGSKTFALAADAKGRLQQPNEAMDVKAAVDYMTAAAK